MKNNNLKSSPFSNDDAKKALVWTKDLVEKTGTRLTGTKGCKKASEIIFICVPTPLNHDNDMDEKNLRKILEEINTR